MLKVFDFPLDTSLRFSDFLALGFPIVRAVFLPVEFPLFTSVSLVLVIQVKHIHEKIVRRVDVRENTKVNTNTITLKVRAIRIRWACGPVVLRDKRRKCRYSPSGSRGSRREASRHWANRRFAMSANARRSPDHGRRTLPYDPETLGLAYM